MPNSCTLCMNNSKKNKDISFFTYPKDPDRRNMWLKIVDREDLCNKIVDKSKLTNYRICEAHFERKYIVYSKYGISKSLAKDSIPTLNLPPPYEVSSSLAAIENARDSVSDDGTEANQTVDGVHDFGLNENTPGEKIPLKRKLSQDPVDSKRSKTHDLNVLTKNFFLTLCDMFLDEDTCQLVKRKMDFDVCSEACVPEKLNNESSNSKNIQIEVPSVSSDCQDQNYKEVLCKVEDTYDEDPLKDADGPISKNNDTNSSKNDTHRKPEKAEHSIDGFLAGIRPILQNLSPCELGSAKMEIIDAMYKYSKGSKEPALKTPNITTEEDSEILIKIEPADVDT